MLANMKIRSKLVAILVAPVVALLALATFGINQRVATERNATEIGRHIQVATKITAVVHELQKERGLSATFLSKADSSQDPVLAQRKLTDKALGDLHAILTEQTGNASGS